MRYSQLLIPTLKEDPAEAEVISHKLLLRGGFIRKLTAGIYTYLPLGLRVLRKVENIVREEMNRAGAQEILMPMVQPGDLWQESERWKKYGPELLRFTDRHDRDYCLGPTHEEVVTDLVRRELHSYRQAPINLYQIQTKFRDEIRPRFGLMRGREFVMKDAYSFDVDDAGAQKSYERMRQAYEAIFTRCGLEFRAVEADTGSIGGNFSHEFMVLAETGEDTLAVCDSCSFAANVEKAPVPAPAARRPEPGPAAEVVDTPGVKQVERVADFLGVETSAIVKTMIFLADGRPVAALVRGDREVQPVKLKHLLGADEVEPAPEEEVHKLTGKPAGYLGPVGLGIPVVADQEVMAMGGFVTGANQKGRHLKNVWPGRDFTPDHTGDIRTAVAGDPCPSCGAGLRLTEGIEVGHIFKLGTSYSEKLGARFQDQDGEEKLFVMGCYGIGVSRVVAAAIEQNHDKDGIVFPLPLAPFQVILLNLDPGNEEISAAAEDLYRQLLARGVETLLDDRDERPGAKFKDADLIGIPLRITVGRFFLKNGQVELRERASGERTDLEPEQALARVLEILEGTV